MVGKFFITLSKSQFYKRVYYIFDFQNQNDWEQEMKTEVIIALK